MHRHTTNSISTASAVFLALRKKKKKKAHFKKRSPRCKMRPPISITTDGVGAWGREASRRTPRFLNSLAFFFIWVQYGFLLWAARWGRILHDWPDVLSWKRRDMNLCHWFHWDQKQKIISMFFFLHPNFLSPWKLMHYLVCLFFFYFKFSELITGQFSYGSIFFWSNSRSLWMKHWFT